MTSISKNVYIDKLDDIVNNKMYHSTFKMKPHLKQKFLEVLFQYNVLPYLTVL